MTTPAARDDRLLQAAGERGAPVAAPEPPLRTPARPEGEPARLDTEPLLRATLDALPALVVVLDEEGTIRLANDAWLRFHAQHGAPGCGEAAWSVGGSYPAVLEAAAPEDAEDARAVGEGIREVAAGRAASFELESLCHAGSARRWFRVHAARLRGGGPVRVVVSHEDVTARKVATGLDRHLARQEAARTEAEAAERRLRAILGSITDGFVACDDQWRLTYLNHVAERALGVPREELIGRVLWDVYPEAAGAPLAGTLREAMAQRVRRRVEAPDGLRPGRWVQVTAYPTDAGLSIVFADVTDRRGAEIALQRSEARLSSILSITTDAIVAVDEEQRILYFNRGAEQIFGYDADEVHGEPLDRLLPASVFGAHRSWVEALARSGETPLPVESHGDIDIVGRRRNGETFPAECTVGRATLAGEEVIYTVVLRDVTEQKRAEAALLESRRQLVQSQKMEAVGRLAGGIAHDFNNILTVIKGYTAILASGLSPAMPLRAELNEIDLAASRAGDLTHQLLAFSRKQVLQPRILSVNTVIDETERMLRRVIGEDVELETALAPGVGLVRADRSQLDQVIINLVVNARDAMPHGGLLCIETREVEVEARRAEPGGEELPPGRYAVIQVSDTGCGMSSDTLERIFEPFFTTKEKGKGTGLGLSTVYGIVSQSGGHIRVRSEPGAGTDFLIYLPIVDAPEPNPETERPESPPPATGRETVLVVEDESAVRSLVRRTLVSYGYDVLDSGSAEEAVDCFRRHGERVALLVTDVVLPGQNGRELAERLTALRPGLKVLYMTGYTEDEIVHRGIERGGAALIDKPFAPEELAHAVRAILDGVAIA